MCLVVPCKVLRVADGHAEVIYDGVRQRVAAPGLPDLAVGEYVTVYAGAVLERMPAELAEEILRFYGELDDLVESAHA
ncbi:MAG TPA: HypC/HybG/HupF family hydrogenase formation chaperone [Chloroflexia bacterium]|nr:HypC/HybG/HupF family hydrogenase formation chaperone [Chloroflexia bacterium]